MFHIDLDLTSLTRLFGVLPQRVSEAATKAAAQLAPAIHAHAVEEANAKLHARRQTFVDNLTFKQVDESNWMVVLDGKARWIDDGLKPHEMIDDLLKSKKTKTAKDGSRYLAIPFNHGPGKGKTSTTPAQQDLIAAVKSAAKAAGVPFGKMQKGPAGNTLLGSMGRLNATTPAKTMQGPGQGWGAIGAPRQGATGIPFLQGLQVSQRMVGGKAKRSFDTFRIVSSKMKGSGRWFHPGLAPARIIDDSYEWGVNHWEQVILPAIYADLTGL